jgi:hypothetical protein
MFDPAVIQQFVDEIRAAEKARAARESATLKLAAANAGLLKDILSELQAMRAGFEAGARESELPSSEASDDASRPAAATKTK